jgi:hypothetical protein
MQLARPAVVERAAAGIEPNGRVAADRPLRQVPPRASNAFRQ